MTEHFLRDRIVIGTRASDLALVQANTIRDRLRRLTDLPIELEMISTQGDKNRTRSFETMEGSGFFTKEIEHALIARKIDLAVHSCKDLETARPPGIAIAAYPERGDRRDVLLIHHEAYDPERHLSLREGASVGTSSVRRIAQLSFLRPDLQFLTLRGNVPTRIARFRRGDFDAIIIAAAGLQRLKLDVDDLTMFPLTEQLVIPAPGQGALAVEALEDDEFILTLLAKLDDVGVRHVVEMEREVLRQLGGGCQMPLGVAGSHSSGAYGLSVFLGRRDGESWLQPRRITCTGKTREETISRAVDYIQRPEPVSLQSRFSGTRVVITREREQSGEFCQSIESAGGEVVSYPTLKVIPAGDKSAVDDAIRNLEAYNWIFFTSGNGVRRFNQELTQRNIPLTKTIKIGVIGPGTGRSVNETFGRVPDFIPLINTGEAFAEEFLQLRHANKVLIPTALGHSPALASRLTDAGIGVCELIVYHTISTPPEELPPWDGRGVFIIFTSPKAAHSFLDRASIPPESSVISIGPATTQALASAGVRSVYEAHEHTLSGILEVLDVLSG